MKENETTRQETKQPEKQMKQPSNQQTKQPANQQTKQQTKQQGIELYEQRMKELQEMNLTSDLFSSVVFEDLSALQDVLRILTRIPDLHVIRATPQRSVRNLYGHSVVLDVWAEDTDGKQYNMELQMSEDEDHVRRSRYIQSVIDSKSFPAGEEYAKLPELYLIFITEKDFLHIGTGITEIIQVVKANRQPVDDGVHRIYANLECPTEADDINRLLTYIKDTNGQTPTSGFEHLAQRVNYLKNDSGGKEYMCKTAERERREGREEGLAAGREEGTALSIIQLTLKKLAKGLTPQEISEWLEEDESYIVEICAATQTIGDGCSSMDIYRYLTSQA